MSITPKTGVVPKPEQQCSGFFMGEIRPGERSEHSLVKATKSPTAIKTPSGAPGAYAVFQFREWSDEYRIRTRVDLGNYLAPPAQSGPRETDQLSARAARKIAESCAYVASEFGGYTTFLTLTFSDEKRAALEAGETTIQREVSRFCDGMAKMYQRGWKAEFVVNGRRMYCADGDGGPQRGEGQEGSFLYCWVAEVPGNEFGEPNPHVHLIMRWQVKYSLFPAWAKRIEALWGQGFAHLERIRDGEAAAAYMMKAAGYLCKSQGREDQGKVRGNRYAISEAARAPDWVTISEHQLHIMGALIADINQHLTEKYGVLYQKRKLLNKKLDSTPREQKHRRRAIGRMLEAVRAPLKKIPVVASQYQIICRGRAAFDEVVAWMRSPGHWRPEVCDWLPEKGPGEAWIPGERPDSGFLEKFRERHYWRRACRAAIRLAWTDREWAQARDYYRGWEPLEPAGEPDWSEYYAFAGP